MRFVFLLTILSVSACKTAQKTTALHTEPQRPQIHFSPEKMWMNDPNGLVYHDGEYHLFYQYYPRDIVWGPMHWGHAVSRDLVHWQHLPIALAPDSLGYIFSGSAVVDERNTSGFQTGSKPPLVAMFTYHDPAKEKAGRTDIECQAIAFSNDRGRTWAKYGANPVISNPGFKDFRDPKMFWHEASGKWVVVFARGDRVLFYNSPDLKKWSLTGEFGEGFGSPGRPWECPDLFELPVENQMGKKKWALLVSLGNGAPNGGSGTQYFIGDFDGKTFKSDSPKESVFWLDYGCDNYAGVTWSNAPAGRRLFIGWMSNWQYAQQVPTAPWRSAMTLPRELRLRHTSQGLRLFAQPVAELQSLRERLYTNLVHEPPFATYYEMKTPTAEIEVEWALPEKTDGMQPFGVLFQNVKGEKLQVGYDPARRELFVDRSEAGKSDFSPQFAGRHTAPYAAGDTLRLRIFLDVSSVELFADDGAAVMTETFFPAAPMSALRAFGDREIRLVRGQAYRLRSIWR